MRRTQRVWSEIEQRASPIYRSVLDSSVKHHILELVTHSQLESPGKLTAKENLVAVRRDGGFAVDVARENELRSQSILLWRLVLRKIDAFSFGRQERVVLEIASRAGTE